MAEMYTPEDFTLFPWMQHALQEHGIREVPGHGSNTRIQEYLRSVGINAGDDTSWCSAFANWCMEQAGLRGTDRGNARSWLTWGGQCLVGSTYGAVTVLWRESPASWKGHVGFYVGREGANLLLLGGNQGNAVSIRPYPASRLLAYRWPLGFHVPTS
jgi:uncharacterized protein (TIGR02594 family)